MITPELVREYEERVGPVEFTTVFMDDAERARVAEMMRAAIRGERGPITDEELGQVPPPDAKI